MFRIYLAVYQCEIVITLCGSAEVGYSLGLDHWVYSDGNAIHSGSMGASNSRREEENSTWP